MILFNSKPILQCSIFERTNNVAIFWKYQLLSFTAQDALKNARFKVKIFFLIYTTVYTSLNYSEAKFLIVIMNILCSEDFCGAEEPKSMDFEIRCYLLLYFIISLE